MSQRRHRGEIDCPCIAGQEGAVAVRQIKDAVPRSKEFSVPGKKRVPPRRCRSDEQYVNGPVCVSLGERRDYGLGEELVKWVLGQLRTGEGSSDVFTVTEGQGKGRNAGAMDLHRRFEVDV